MTPDNHDVHPMYFDVAGQPMDKATFMKRYPERLRHWCTPLFGMVVVSEFVGMNHNPRYRGSPWIYQTWVRHAGNNAVPFSIWSGGLKRSMCWHVFACVLTVFGGALWWRLP